MANCQLKFSNLEKFETTDVPIIKDGKIYYNGKVYEIPVTTPVNIYQCKSSELRRQRAIGAGIALGVVFVIISLIAIFVGGAKLIG
jgi:hypothetical protein